MLLIVCLYSALVGLAVATEHSQTPLFMAQGNVIPGRYIVKLKQSTSFSVSSALVAKYTTPTDPIYSHLFQGFAATVDDVGLQALRLDPSVSG